MEIQFTIYIMLLIFFLSFLKFIIPSSGLEHTTKSNNTKKLAPGPKKLPLIGNLHQLLSSPPHRVLHKLTKIHGPIMHLNLGELSAIVISSPKTAKEFLQNDLNFAQRKQNLSTKLIFYGASELIFSSYGDYWRQLRKVYVKELLSPKRVQSFRSVREEEVSKTIKNILTHKNCPINLSETLYNLIFNIVSRIVFGKIGKEQETLKLLVMEVDSPATGFTWADMFPSFKFLQTLSGLKPKLVKLFKKVDRVLQDSINEHKKSVGERTCNRGKGEDHILLDVLLNIQTSNGIDFVLSDTQIKAIILDLFIAGKETSSVLIEWTMSELLKNPEIMRKAQVEVRKLFKEKGTVDETNVQELRYLKAVIKETLRLHPPATLTHRECRENCEILGYNIPKETYVIVNLWAICRDPEYWSEAERFCPERFLDSSINYNGSNFQYIPFGSGRRMCPGFTFAMSDVEVPLAQLLFHFDWEFPPGMKPEKLDMDEQFGVSTRRKNDLFFIPIPYNH